MPAALLQLARRYDAMTLRERVLVMAGVLALLVYGYAALALAPAWNERRALVMAVVQQRSAVRELDAALGAARQRGGDAALRAYRDRLRAQIADRDREMRSMQATLVPPADMPGLLQRVLAQGRLQLVALRKLPVERVSPQAQADAGRAIYRHTFVLEVTGSYVDLYDYLVQLEASPWRMYWGRIELDASAHPKLVATLTVHTLSLDRAWLAV
jgi:MSHA biogenesis protein MshJ